MKYRSFRGSSLKNDYLYTDPLEKLSRKEFAALESSGLLDYLEELWFNGTLPQKFTLREGAAGMRGRS